MSLGTSVVTDEVRLIPGVSAIGWLISDADMLLSVSFDGSLAGVAELAAELELVGLSSSVSGLLVSCTLAFELSQMEGFSALR